MEKSINADQAKEKISLVRYLQLHGHEPVSMSGKRHCYRSPFRDEKKPSMFVDDTAGLWNDFGHGGGSIIDLAMALHNFTNVSDTLQHLSNFVSQSVHLKIAPTVENQVSLFDRPNTSITNVRSFPLNHFVLLKYLREKRGISDVIAQQYLRLIRYDNKGRKDLFGMGWKNESGAWELRSAGNNDFKAVTGRKNMTIIPALTDAKPQCFLFESMLDFLSVLMLKNKPFLDGEVIILNSTSLIKKIVKHLETKRFETVFTFFDNDRAGEKAFAKFQTTFEHSDIRPQTFYHPFNDVNDYWVDKRTCT